MASTIPVVYDSPDFIVVNKPCDIPMHDSNIGICQLLRQQLSLKHLYLVHRLDSPTSGCLLLAKNKPTAAALSAQFADKKIEKYYIAISDTKPKKKQGKISGGMRKSRQGSYMLSPLEPGQTSAVTFFISEAFHDLGRLYYVKPVTGKTHQIRVALKSLGSPILGDGRYKGTQADRLYLHSMMLKFSYNGYKHSISCLPMEGEYFTDPMLQEMRDVESLTWPKYISPKNTVPNRISSETSGYSDHNGSNNAPRKRPRRTQ
jgi:tRNA pseudouridine32 synthase/23S rRNA pseudouridine746 synthase